MGSARAAFVGRAMVSRCTGPDGMGPVWGTSRLRKEAAQKGQRAMNVSATWPNRAVCTFKTKASGRGHGSCFDPLPSIT